MLMLNLDTIAKKSGLREEGDISWRDGDVPLHERGVHLEWLNDFVWNVSRDWQDILEQHEYHRKANIYFDNVPEPSPLPFPAGQEMTSAFLVANVIQPMTEVFAGPLFARIPKEYIGRPDLFVSHAWSNPLVGNAFAELEALRRPYVKRGTTEYVWLDVVCYNQHRAESVAADMKAIVASIGRVGIPMVNSVPFSRLWCLWELLCAHVAEAEVHVYEATGSVYDLGYLARCFHDEFKSVERAATTLSSDRDQILSAMVSTFGSIQKTDDYVHLLVDGMLSKDSDKPWNRAASRTEQQ